MKGYTFVYLGVLIVVFAVIEVQSQGVKLIMLATLLHPLFFFFGNSNIKLQIATCAILGLTYLITILLQLFFVVFWTPSDCKFPGTEGSEGVLQEVKETEKAGVVILVQETTPGGNVHHINVFLMNHKLFNQIFSCDL